MIKMIARLVVQVKRVSPIVWQFDREAGVGSYLSIGTLIMVMIILVSCSSSPPPPEKIIFNKVIYPELPPVDHPKSVELINCQWDLPLLTTRYVVIKDRQWEEKACSDYPQSSWSDPLFSKACLQHPVDSESNLVIGFDRENWQCYQKNLAHIRAALAEYKLLVDTINQQRVDWIRKNKLEMFGDKVLKDTGLTQ